MKEVNEMTEQELRNKIKMLNANLAKLRIMRQWGYAGADEPVGDVIRRRLAYRRECEARLKEIRKAKKSKDTIV